MFNIGFSDLSLRDILFTSTATHCVNTKSKYYTIDNIDMIICYGIDKKNILNKYEA